MPAGKVASSAIGGQALEMPSGRREMSVRAHG